MWKPSKEARRVQHLLKDAFSDADEAVFQDTVDGGIFARFQDSGREVTFMIRHQGKEVYVGLNDANNGSVGGKILSEEAYEHLADWCVSGCEVPTSCGVDWGDGREGVLNEVLAKLRAALMVAGHDEVRGIREAMGIVEEMMGVRS